MKELLIAENTVPKENGMPLHLSYFLVSELLMDDRGCPVCEMYGARIEKDAEGAPPVSRRIPGITMLRGEIVRIVRSLSEHAVMPETMVECLEGLLP